MKLEWLVVIVSAGGAAILALLWRLWSAVKEAGRNEIRLERAKERALELERIRRAHDARPTGGLHEDPNNRDT